MPLLWCATGFASLTSAEKAGARKRSADECFEANSALVRTLADGWAEQPGRATKQVKQYDGAGPNLKLLLLLALCQKIKHGEQPPLLPHTHSSLHVESCCIVCNSTFFLLVPSQLERPAGLCLCQSVFVSVCCKNACIYDVLSTSSLTAQGYIKRAFESLSRTIDSITEIAVSEMHPQFPLQHRPDVRCRTKAFCEHKKVNFMYSNLGSRSVLPCCCGHLRLCEWVDTA